MSSGEHYFWVFWGVKFSHKFTILRAITCYSFLSFSHSFSHSPTHPGKSSQKLTVIWDITVANHYCLQQWQPIARFISQPSSMVFTYTLERIVIVDSFQTTACYLRMRNNISQIMRIFTAHSMIPRYIFCGGCAHTPCLECRKKVTCTNIGHKSAKVKPQKSEDFVSFSAFQVGQNYNLVQYWKVMK